jgi:hypothetical protein
MGAGYKIIIAPFLKVSHGIVPLYTGIKERRMAVDAVLINHERIHLRQQAELLVIPFYLLYLLNYLFNLLIYRSHHKAYIQIVFEREAYANEADTGYLKTENGRHGAGIFN